MPTATGVRVVDASALAALLFGEPDAAWVTERLESARRVAPSLLTFELANVCLAKCRRHPAQKAALIESPALRTRLPVEEIAVDQMAVLDLAAETGLAAYDASYLWLARRLDAELVTLDRQSARAAEA